MPDGELFELVTYGIGAVIDVEQAALGRLEEDALAGLRARRAAAASCR